MCLLSGWDLWKKRVVQRKTLDNEREGCKVRNAFSKIERAAREERTERRERGKGVPEKRVRLSQIQ